MGSESLHVPCLYRHLRVIRKGVMDLCARAGLSELKASQLEMAVDEACANIIEHSYGGEPSPQEEPKHPGLRVNLSHYADRVVVELRDHGKGFDFEEKQPVDPKQFVQGENPRGLGLYIIHRFVDEVTYERGTPGGHCLRLTKRI